MRVEQVLKGRTMKRVLISGVGDQHTDEEILNLALDAANENMSSLFDTRVTRMGDIAKHSALVTLFTD